MVLFMSFCFEMIKRFSIFFILHEGFREGIVKVRLPTPLITISRSIVGFSQQDNERLNLF